MGKCYESVFYRHQYYADRDGSQHTCTHAERQKIPKEPHHQKIKVTRKLTGMLDESSTVSDGKKGDVR